MITDWKWKAKIAVENAESALKMKKIIGTVANGKAGLGLHPQRWWSKEFMLNRRKMVSEKIHYLEEVKHFATAVGQRKQGPSGRVQKTELSYKSSQRRLTNTSQPCLGVDYIRPMQCMRENCQPQIYSHWM